MQIAFYAPLKPADHPVPSGDRLMAQMLCRALALAGHQVDVAARLRSRVGDGNILKQARMAELGTKLAGRLLRHYQSGFRTRPDVWFTYHLYYKAPDWIGPIVADALGIPYVVAEASFAPKRAAGPWMQSHRAVETALVQADAVFSLNRADMECLIPVCGAQKLVFLPPFTDVANWQVPDRGAINPDRIKLVTTAMMRDGDKLQSYDVLAQSLGKLLAQDVANWHLTVIGDGPVRERVEALFTGNRIPRDHVRFVGLCSDDRMRELLAQADLYVWPAINEAYGMALLEAQAAGLPVLAGDAGGVSGIVSHGDTGWLVTVDSVNVGADVDAFADRLGRCLTDDAGAIRPFGVAAAKKARTSHTVDAAAQVLDRGLQAAVTAYGRGRGT